MEGEKPPGLARKLAPVFDRIFRPLLDDARGKRNRRLLGTGVAVLIAVSLVLPAVGLVQLKMLPFDNKSGVPGRRRHARRRAWWSTAAVLHEPGNHSATLPEVTDYQAYVGTGATDQLNGLSANITCAPVARSATSR